TNPDCYVCLRLPTSHTETKTTRTVWNCKDPVWDETFHFRVHSYIKNILELSLHDKDITTADDHLYTVSYDLGNVPLNKSVVENFILNKERHEELHVEFNMVNLPETCKKVITNGVLVCPEMSELQVHVEKQRYKKKLELALTVPGSYEKSHSIVIPKYTTGSSTNQTLTFHYPKDLEMEFCANLKKVYSSLDVTFKNESNDSLFQTTVPLHLISPESENNIHMEAVEDKPVKMQLQVKECPENLDVRLGFSLCNKEKKFLYKRQAVVASALKEVLHLTDDLVGEEVPVVAVMATGGGARAMSCLYSHLYALKKIGVLDCVTYIAGASGSTWTMSNLYKDPDWSQNELSEFISTAKEQVTRTKTGAFSLDRLKYYRAELQKAAVCGQKTSFADLWGLMLESMFHDGKNESKLSDQKAALIKGQNPLPIYLAINVKHSDISTLQFKEWCEFTPYEVGLLKYGAFIRTEDFGSEFYMGRLMKKHPEPRICYLQGLWGNVFSLNLIDTWYLTTQIDTFWDTWVKDKTKDIDENELQTRRESAHLKTHLFTPPSTFGSLLKGMLTSRPIDGEQQNFLQGLHLHTDYLQNSQFCTWKDTHLDSFPNKLTPLSDNLCLVDAGYFINASFPPLLRQQRKVDVILSFDYTLDTPLMSVQQTCKYCTEQGIGFPKVSLKEEEKEKANECYRFTDEDNPEAPIVLHFPLVNDTFRDYKEPGVLRTPEEMSEGDVDVSGYSPYFLTNFTYSEQDFDKLMKLTQYNVENSSTAILDALHTAVERKKLRSLSSRMYQTQQNPVQNFKH
ncbi:hypothetical protein GDO86_016182, partial [Hymenochirus boettgeri]